MAFHHRLRRLERAAATWGGPCPACGLRLRGPVRLMVEPPTVIGEPRRAVAPPPPPCRACGRTGIIRLVVTPPRDLDPVTAAW